MSEQLNELGAYIEAKRPDCILGWDIAFDELNMDVTQANLPGLVEFIKSDAVSYTHLTLPTILLV